MSNPYGPTVETRADWNTILDECGCCAMPGCTAPSWEFRYKDATLSGWYLYTALSSSPAPTDCAALWSKWGAYEIEYDYSAADSLPGSPGEFDTATIKTYSATLTHRHEKDYFTGDATVTHTGSGTFTIEDFSTESDGMGGWQWKAAPDFSETWTVAAAGDGSSWEWDYENSDEVTDSGTWEGVEGNTTNLATEGIILDTGINSQSWTAEVFTLEYDECTETRSLKDELTESALEAAAATYFGTISYTTAGAAVEASRTVTHPTTTGSCTDEDHVDDWSERIIGYRAIVAAGHGGDYFRIDWDEAKTIGSTVTLSAKSWEWNSPASKTGAWSSDVALGAGEYGTIELANDRFICYVGPYGSAPDPGEFDEIEAT